MKITFLLAIASILGLNAQEDISTLLQEYVENSDGVGAAVGWIDGGKVDFFTYGKESANGDEPISQDTVFEIGSITKVFTTLALMDLVDRGEVQLDDPVEQHLPGVRVPEKDGTKMTLRHLAVHISGLPRMPDNFAPENPNNPYNDATIEKLYEYLNNFELKKVPGTEFEYSNTGMGLLGHIISLHEDKSYDEVIQDVICRKLGMENTAVSLTPEMKRHFAKGHNGRQEVEHWDFPFLPGMGGLRSNIRNMTRFLAANMGISDAPIARLMNACHKEEFAFPGTEQSIGLAWIRGTELIWHNGGTGGFRSYLGFNPKTGKGVVILTNSTEGWPDEMGSVLLDPGFTRPHVDHELAKRPGYLSQCAGFYRAVIQDLPPQELQVIVYGKELWLSLSGGEAGVLYPESFGVFGMSGFPDGRVDFTFDDQGKVTKIEAFLRSTGESLWEAFPN